MSPSAPAELRGFDEASALTSAPGDSRRALISDEFSGFGGAHGGFVASLALRALTELVDDPQRLPRSLTIQLLAPVRTGPLNLRTRISRAGRSMSAGSVHLEQEGSTVGVALGAFGIAAPSLSRRDVAMPDVPPPEECEIVELSPPGVGSFKHRVTHRAAAPPLPLSGSTQASITVWMRMVQERPLDALAATFLADSAPPALVATLTEFHAIPSAEIALHYAPGLTAASGQWVLGVFRSRTAADGYCVEDGELWAPDGELLLQSRQLRRIL
jgi:acyl-CoA thioesterase